MFVMKSLFILLSQFFSRQSDLELSIAEDQQLHIGAATTRCALLAEAFNQLQAASKADEYMAALVRGLGSAHRSSFAFEGR